MEGRTREGRGVRWEPDKMVRFGMYRIRSVRNIGTELELLRLAQGEVDCGVIQETKLTDGVYTRKSSGFRVTAKAVLSDHSGGVAILYRKAGHFVIEELRLHSPNVISFQMVTGRHRWHVVGFYIAPSDASIIEHCCGHKVSTLRGQAPGSR